VSSHRSPAAAWTRQQQVHRDRYERCAAAIQVAQAARQESREIVSCCLEGRVRRQGGLRKRL
jgi:hypothetical protein